MNIDQDIDDALQKLKDSYDLVWELFRRRDSEERPLDITETSRANLIFFFKNKIFHLTIFELLLKYFPSDAIDLIKRYYLSVNLANSPHDHVADLDIMFDDIKLILGDSAFEELLNCPEFLPKNKKNKRVKEAIDFAYAPD